jgi:magnesium chelatase subunit D
VRSYPFSAVVGSDDMALALVLTSISPEVGGVLVRGEKGTAKSTMVRALAAVQPDQLVVQGCRFSCDPADPDPGCPDGPHLEIVAVRRPARLVELPVGATEDRVIGSLDLREALGSGQVSYEPGLLAAAHRGILYVDEVNLLHDHLVDLLLDAAAMGRSTVERDGVSIAHAARLVLVGTMNPEEGELRPQLLDRFGLTVEVAAPREPGLRSEVVRRRLAFDADPVAFSARFANEEEALRTRLASAQARMADVRLTDWALDKIATVCAGFEVDGMRADIVTARAAVAHAAWHDRTTVTRADIRAAARLALPHRRRRNPFDAPGLDEELLDHLLGDDDQQPDPEPPAPEPEGAPAADGSATDAPLRDASDAPAPDAADRAEHRSDQPAEHGPEQQPSTRENDRQGSPTPLSVAEPGEPYRARLLAARGTGSGEAGHRSRALTTVGRTVGAAPTTGARLHFPATVRAAATEQHRRGRLSGERLRFDRTDLRTAVTEGRESNLVLFCVDASGSMAARKRMAEVKTAVLSLLLDAYQRRDKVGLVTFRGTGAVLALPPTSSVDIGARRLTELPSGGRTPLAEGLLCAAETLRWERIRDPRRRPLLVVVTDGRATAGTDAVPRSRRAATYLTSLGVDAVVVDCESGRMSLGLALGLAEDLRADYVKLADVNAEALTAVASTRRSAA